MTKAIKAQLQQKNAHNPHGVAPGGSSSVYKGCCATRTYRIPTHKATLPILRDIAVLLIHRNKDTEAAKMRRQRNMSQMKEQSKTPEKKLDKMETSNLPDAAFKTLVKEMLNEPRGRVDELSENLNKGISNIK